MALFVNQNSNRTKLQEKLAAELNEKARQSAAGPDPGTQHDGVNDSKYLEGTKQTTSLAWVWALIALAAVGAVIWLVIASSNR